MTPGQPDVPAAITPPGMDPDRLLLAQVDTSGAPHLSIGELANTIFGMSTHWVRWREQQGWFDNVVRDPDGTESRDRPGSRTPSNARVYTLSDAERMIIALASGGRISGDAAMARLQVVYWMARVRGYLPAPDGADTSIPEEEAPPVVEDPA